MTQEDFSKDEWTQIGRFDSISCTQDGQREFMAKLLAFRQAEKRGEIPETGYDMPDCGGVAVGKILELEYIPDWPIDMAEGRHSDGVIVVKKF